MKTTTLFSVFPFGLSLNIFAQTPDDFKKVQEALEQEKREALIGTPFPEFLVTTAKGELHTLPKMVKTLFIFWAIWCAPCLKELPMVSNLYSQGSIQKFRLVYINLDFQEGYQEKAITWFKEKDIRGNAHYYPADTKDEYMVLKYLFPRIPAAFLVDEQGILIDGKVGAFSSKSDFLDFLSRHE